MRVLDGVEKTIVYVGRATPTGQFLPYGTGFLVAVQEEGVSYQSIVTARHVIDQVQGTDVIQVRINTKAGGTNVIPTDRNSWVSPDNNIDLALWSGFISMKVYDILHVSLDNILDTETIEKQEIGLGEDVFICGMFLSKPGETRNIPIVRAGVLSGMPSEKVRTDYGHHHVFLVEARSTGGISGSPVFLQMPPFRLVNGKLSVRANEPLQYFAGMVLGHNKLSHPAELIQFLPIDRREAEDIADEHRERSVPLTTGIAVVLPATYVVEALISPVITAKRRKP